ncbi:hypothetical protein [Kocuria turfanensis]|uniref:PDGLE domain-containing protein n=1 Tax=Kocuria turfanensis TaxID=388357 RepID=A0A512ICC5_9MICC|nr:hypothetical protein [Kocuria turfanensis]GEO95332.1 hypothetical protein KTU01_14550 [Kocuria turfanensis]
MPAPAARRLALAAAPAVLACVLAVPPAAAGAPETSGVVRTEIGPGPAAGDPRTVEDLVPAARVVLEPVSSFPEQGRGPLLAVGGAVVALMGAFVAGLSRRPDPVD